MIQSVGPMEAALNFLIIIAIAGALALVLALVYVTLIIVLRFFGYEVHE